MAYSPHVGENGDEVLKSIGLSDDEIARMKAEAKANEPDEDPDEILKMLNDV